MGKDPEVERTSKGKRSITRMAKEKRDNEESGVYFTEVKSECKHSLKETHKRFFNCREV